MNSLVEMVKWEGMIPAIWGVCHTYGLDEVVISRLGGYHVLLSFKNLENVWQVIKDSNLEFSSTALCHGTLEPQARKKSLA